MASALLRKLLLDGEPLVDAVNRGRRLRIRYEVNHCPPHNKDYWVVLDELDPDPDSGYADRPTRALTRDQFLQCPVIMFEGHQYNVGYVIKHLAHVEGGRPRQRTGAN